MEQYFTSEIIPEISSLITSKKVQVLDKTEMLDIINHFLETHQSDQPFYIVNLKEVIQKINLWRDNLPNVEPFYAIKCNPDEVVIKLMASMGLGFDCASKNEIAKVISADVHPEKIIFANPCKLLQDIKYARANDVDLMTFDSSHELYKIKLYHPSAKLVIRIQVDDSKSKCKFNCKFGVRLDEVKDLLQQAKFMDLDIVGVSFHVGSGCQDPSVFKTALKDCRQVYDIGKEMGFNLNLIDFGGGFPGNDDEEFLKMASVINSSIDEYFKDLDVKFIAEPGRYFVTSAYTLITSIINKKILKNPDDPNDKHIVYYLSEGIYGSFNNFIFDHAKIELLPFNERNEKTYECTVFGPSCDSFDRISSDSKLPELSIGEIIYVLNMGAYTLASRSNFNGFESIDCRYIIN
jgi:ornithine decarboxylase